MSSKSQPVVSAAIDQLPPELQGAVANWFDRLAESGAGAEVPDDLAQSLVRTVACSEFAAGVLLRELRWLMEQALELPPDPAALQAFADSIATSDEPVDAIKRQLRRYRNRYLLHVLWREVDGSADLEETLTALSDLADRLLGAAAHYAERQLHERFGIVRDDTGNSVSMVILGMGKLGGGELNFSSDVDLVFLYPGGNDSDGARSLSPSQYFTRVSQTIVALLDEVTSDGFAFRVDTRLRPFGDSGPPVTSFAALESYLTRHGRGWERYAYVKARIVGQAPPTRVATELYEDLILPFVYRRYLDFGVFESLRDMHALIAAEVERRELAQNVKLGPGGIREIEFIVQALQLVRGGSRRELQERKLQKVLPRLEGHHGISAASVNALLDAYAYLRRVENFIQAIRDQQTHELPADPVDRARLCVAMGCASWSELEAALESHREKVSREFDAIAFREHERAPTGVLRERLADLWETNAAPPQWVNALEEAGVNDAGEVAAAIAAFADSRATQRIDESSRQRLRRFIPDALLLLSACESPVIVLQRMLAIVEKVLRRSAYLALLNENAPARERLVSLCEQSGHVADQIARFPALLDELLDPRIYTARITRVELERELKQRLAGKTTDDSELQMELLAKFQRASQFRIAVADFNGSLPIMRVSDSLTDLAETILGRALAVAWGDLTSRHGVPEYEHNGARRPAGFGIIAYGKLGGIELSYGSDLDLVFLHDSQGNKQLTNGERPLDNAMFFTRLVRRLVHFLTTQTGSGNLYEVDMRLRPDGRSGLLVTSIDAFERYQEENAWTWEHQALLRARPVAGSAVIAREFERIRADTLTSRVHRDTLRHDVLTMRQRMRKELDKSSKDSFDLKQGTGGIGDIEFIVQFLVLANAGTHRAVIHYPDNIRQLATLAKAGCLDVDSATRLQDIYRSYRRRLHHLALDDKPAVAGAADFAAERAFVRAVWQEQVAV